MDEYIDRDYVIKDLVTHLTKLDGNLAEGYNLGIKAACSVLSCIPAADVAPVVHGRWVVKYEIWGKNVKTVEGYKCSKCDGFSFYQDNYCADCGARMDEVTE